LARFTPSSLPAVFQGFWILTLISTLGSWGCPSHVDFWDFLAKKFPLGFACLISRLLDSHPHMYLGLMGLSPRCRLLGLVGKKFPTCLCMPYFKAFGFSPSYLPWAHGLSPSCRLLGLVSKNVCVFVFFAASFTPIAPPHAGLHSEPLFLESLWHQA
jgi:hypothetical protein